MATHTPTPTSKLVLLPTELRLQIYNHILPLPTPGRFAYLYRSPGRITRDGPVTRGPHLILLRICQQIRNEVLDSMFADKIFVLECSLYEKDVCGLLSLPDDFCPQVWLGCLRRVVLFTALDFERPMRMGRLLPIQRMPGLKELWVVFKVLPRGTVDGIVGLNVRPIKALVESIPKACRIRIGASEDDRSVFLSELGSGLRYLFDDESSMEAGFHLADLLVALTARQGLFSGSEIDHGDCVAVCRTGDGCVNSCIKTETSKASASPAIAVADEPGWQCSMQ